VGIEVKFLGAGDEGILANVAAGVFDDAVDTLVTREFLVDPRHHLVVAVDAGRVVGFASAVHYVHPDKPYPELWINEIGVAATHRSRGVGKALLHSLLERGRQVNCVEAWVLTDRDNAAALRLYAAVGGREAVKDQVMFTFSLTAPVSDD
jgi:GNAT superfamily N-acetyltransferase